MLRLIFYAIVLYSKHLVDDQYFRFKIMNV